MIFIEGVIIRGIKEFVWPYNLLTLSSTLKVLTYPLILGIIKTRGLITLSYFITIKYLELIFVLTNFEATILSTLASPIFIGFLQH